jgi:hypothetical protein
MIMKGVKEIALALYAAQLVTIRQALQIVYREE